MQFGLKFFTLLTLVALVGSALGLPVANEETAAQPILEKRWNYNPWVRSWGTQPFQATAFNNRWAFGTQQSAWPVGLIGGQPFAWRNGWYGPLSLSYFPNGLGWYNLPDFSNWVNGVLPNNWFY